MTRSLLALALALTLSAGPSSARPRGEGERGAPTTAIEVAIAHRIAELARARLAETGIVDATIEVARVELSEAVAPGAALTALALSSPGRPVGRLTARARVAHGAAERDVWIKAEVAVLVPTVVAARPIARGALLVEGDARVEPRPLADGRLGLVSALLGSQARTALVAGEPIGTRDLTAPQLVRRGDAVTVMVTGDSFALAASGEALDGGARGDEIAVRMSFGQKAVVRGVVTDARRVELR